ncbi:hypothetical protein D3C81_1317210 [compost metagenome]
MVTPHQQHHRLGHGGAVGHARVRRRVVGQADMGEALGHLVQHVVHGQADHVDVELRIARAERRQHLVDQRIGKPLADDQPHLALLKPLQGVELIFQLLLVGAIAAPELEQMRGRLGRPQPARLALEQRRPQFVLQ